MECKYTMTREKFYGGVALLDLSATYTFHLNGSSRHFMLINNSGSKQNFRCPTLADTDLHFGGLIVGVFSWNPVDLIEIRDQDNVKIYTMPAGVKRIVRLYPVPQSDGSFAWTRGTADQLFTV